VLAAFDGVDAGCVGWVGGGARALGIAALAAPLVPAQLASVRFLLSARMLRRSLDRAIAQ
jgi:hypothetical protein